MNRRLSLARSCVACLLVLSFGGVASASAPRHRIPPGALVQEGRPVDPRWSPDGQRVAYRLRRGGQWIPVMDGVELEPYDFLSPAQFSPDGKHCLFVACRKKGTKRGRWKAERWWVLVNGEPRSENAWISSLTFFEGGRRAAWWTNPKAVVEETGAYSLTPHFIETARLDGKKWRSRAVREKFMPGGLAEFTVSKDGESLAALVSAKGTTFVAVLEGKRTTLLPKRGLERNPRRLVYHSEASWAVECLDLDYETRVFKGTIYHAGQEHGAGYDDAGQVALHGGRLAYFYERAGKLGLNLEGEERLEGVWDHVGELDFSPEGERLSFVGSKGGKAAARAVAAGTSFLLTGVTRLQTSTQTLRGAKQRVVLSSCGGEAEDALGPEFETVWDLTWSEGGRWLAYRARTGKSSQVVVGDRRGLPHDVVGQPRFAPDGASVSFGTLDGDEFGWETLSLEE